MAPICPHRLHVLCGSVPPETWQLCVHSLNAGDHILVLGYATVQSLLCSTLQATCPMHLAVSPDDWADAQALAAANASITVLSEPEAVELLARSQQVVSW
ncbi:MAG: hypothetical protein ACR2PW_01195 [Gammaproteobacteria bacterium]